MNFDLKNVAGAYAEEYCSNAICPSHLFKAVLHKDAKLVAFIEKDLGKDYYYMQELADIQMQLSPKSPKPIKDLPLSDESVAVMEEAEKYMEKMGLDSVEPVCVLASLVTPGVGFSFNQLQTLPLTAAEICDKVGAPVAGKGKAKAPAASNQASAASTDTIYKYCTDLAEIAKNGEMPAVVGFEGVPS